MTLKDEDNLITVFEYNKEKEEMHVKQKLLVSLNFDEEAPLSTFESSSENYLKDVSPNSNQKSISNFEDNKNEGFKDDRDKGMLDKSGISIDADSSNDKSAVRYIKNLRKNRIKYEKADYKNRIKNASDNQQKQALKEEFKDKIKLGKELNTDDNIIELRDVNKYYFTSGRYERILKNISFKVPKGKVVLIIGPSGTGKTTLLNVISGLDHINTGNLIVANHNLFYLNDNKKIDFRAKHLSFVFQSYNLISTLNVEENVKIGANLRNKNSEEIPVKQILENLGLADQAKKYPYQLSGGQQQRVSIARALAKNPEILFADEPTGALDEERGRETIKLLMDINQKYKTTVVIVTHNPNLQQISDIIIKVKDGKIDQFIVNENKDYDVKNIKWS